MPEKKIDVGEILYEEKLLLECKTNMEFSFDFQSIKYQK